MTDNIVTIMKIVNNLGTHLEVLDLDTGMMYKYSPSWTGMLEMELGALVIIELFKLENLYG